MGLGLVREGVESGLGLRLRREDSLDGGQREGAVATSAGQSGGEVLLRVGSQKSEQPRGLVFPVAAGSDEFLEKGRPVGTELGELGSEKLLALFVLSGSSTR